MKEAKVDKCMKKEEQFFKTNYVLVNASGGFGKTTKVRKYMVDHQKKYQWLEMDCTCNQKEVLAQRILEQVKQQPKSLHSGNADFFVWNENIDVERRLNKILDYIRENCDVIVFDNIHVLKQKDVLELLERLINHNKFLKWIFIGRNEPDFLIRPIFLGQCAVVREKELVFSQDDVIREVCEKLSYPREYARKVAVKLQYYFQGWPAGIYAVLRYLKEKSMEYTQINWEDIMENSQISGYIQAEILNHIPKEDLEILKQMSLLMDDQGTFENLYPRQYGGYEEMKRLERRHFFVMEIQDKFTMIPAFQMTLMKMANKEERLHIFRMVSEYYVKKNQYVQANAYAVWINDETCMEQYLSDYGKTLLKEEKWELWMDCIRFWLEKQIPLPVSVLQFMAGVFIWVQDQKPECMLQKERKQEQGFYLNLLSYNENPYVSSRYFMEYFKKMIKQEKSKRKGTVLYITSFGAFCVKLGKERKELAWRTKKGCELFAYLHHMQGTPVTRNALLDILWPEGHPKNAVVMLHNMIYHIRKELTPYGLEEVIQYKDKMYSLNMEWIESDIDIMENLDLNQDNAFIKHYPGRYLGNIDNSWTMELKEFYDKKYLDVCMSSVERYIKLKDYEEAIGILKNVLKVNNLEELAYERLIYCLGQTGDRKSVFLEYQNIKNRLHDELGIEPCQNLKKMYKKMME